MSLLSRMRSFVSPKEEVVTTLDKSSTIREKMSLYGKKVAGILGLAVAGSVAMPSMAAQTQDTVSPTSAWVAQVAQDTRIAKPVKWMSVSDFVSTNWGADEYKKHGWKWALVEVDEKNGGTRHVLDDATKLQVGKTYQYVPVKWATQKEIIQASTTRIASVMNTKETAQNKDPLKDFRITSDEFVKHVEDYLGVPYKWGWKDPNQSGLDRKKGGGLDCSGLVSVAISKALNDQGKNLDRKDFMDTRKLRANATKVPLTEAEKWDFLFYNTKTTRHVLVATGSPTENGKIPVIDAPGRGRSVASRLFPLNLSGLIAARPRFIDNSPKVAKAPTGESVFLKFANSMSKGSMDVIRRVMKNTDNVLNKNLQAWKTQKSPAESVDTKFTESPTARRLSAAMSRRDEQVLSEKLHREDEEIERAIKLSREIKHLENKIALFDVKRMEKESINTKEFKEIQSLLELRKDKIKEQSTMLARAKSIESRLYNKAVA